MSQVILLETKNRKSAGGLVPLPAQLLASGPHLAAGPLVQQVRDPVRHQERRRPMEQCVGTHPRSSHRQIPRSRDLSPLHVGQEHLMFRVQTLESSAAPFLRLLSAPPPLRLRRAVRWSLLAGLATGQTDPIRSVILRPEPRDGRGCR